MSYVSGRLCSRVRDTGLGGEVRGRQLSKEESQQDLVWVTCVAPSGGPEHFSPAWGPAEGQRMLL